MTKALKAIYRDWIAANVLEVDNKCAEATLAMLEVFPELTRVRGHYYDFALGERPHWWLTDPEGNIVDPTAAQFPSGGRGVYVPWDESQPEPTGRCPNCSELCYDGNYCCSPECSRSYAAYCLNPY